LIIRPLLTSWGGISVLSLICFGISIIAGTAIVRSVLRGSLQPPPQRAVLPVLVPVLVLLKAAVLALTNFMASFNPNVIIGALTNSEDALVTTIRNRTTGRSSDYDKDHPCMCVSIDFPQTLNAPLTSGCK
jgi:hypothetical protein